MLELTVIGSGSTSRIPEIMAGPSTHVTVIANARSPLRHSHFVDRFVEIDYDAYDDLAPALLARRDLLEDLSGWVIFSEDNTPRALARSDLPIEMKLRILPARREEGLSMLGSKIGLASLMRDADVAGPRTEVAPSPTDLPAALARLGGPAIIKGDLGAGGGSVMRWDTSVEAVPDDWFPVIVQEFIDGSEASVEVLFRDGELMGWTYSRMLAATHTYGPSTYRVFQEPPTRDFVEDVVRMGQTAGLHGFFNCSLMWSPSSPRHYLFELDPRPNAWHQFGPRLGVDWRALMSGAAPTSPRSPAFGAGNVRTLRLYPRELVEGLNHRDWAAISPWLLPHRGTWGTRNHRDRAVNAIENRDVRTLAVSAVRLSVLIGMVRAWGALPVGVREAVERTGLRGRAAAPVAGDAPA